tara:strand:+ start:344 stop:703 length:360 start_codon:yes stop_codon:yes gene_type:complete
MSYDYINPNHYKSGGKEVWEMMIDCYGLEAYINFCQLNAFKYRMRAGKKPNSTAQDDIKKAQWYEEKIDMIQQNKLNDASNDPRKHLQDNRGTSDTLGVSTEENQRRELEHIYWETSNW